MATQIVFQNSPLGPRTALLNLMIEERQRTEAAAAAAAALMLDAVNSFQSVSSALTWLTGGDDPRPDGITLTIRGRGAFETKAGATVIPDMAGLIPRGNVTPEHFGPIDGANDEIQINAAISYVDSLGGGEVWCLSRYTVAPSGTWSTTNGDLNAAVRVETTNPVVLRGIPNKSRITLGGSRICHVVIFGRRVGTSIPSKGGIDGIDVVGNRLTALSEGVPFAGGANIVLCGPGDGVVVRNLKSSQAYAYGIAGQRAYFSNCTIENVIVEDTGNDGIDLKFDYAGDYSADSPAALEGGNANNWVRNVYVRRFALSWASLAGQKAGVDARVGWNAENIAIEMTTPACGFRTQHDDETITTPELGGGAPSTDNDKIRWQSKYSNIEVFASGTLTGSDSTGAAMEAKGFQFGTYRPLATNLAATGAVQNFWIRSVAGSFTNLVGRAATGINLAVYGTVDASGHENKFFGGEMVGAVQQDIRIYGVSSGKPTDTSFFGIKAGVVQIDAEVARTGFYDCEIGTMTDSGDDTLRIKAGAPAAFKAGRNAGQFLHMYGDELGNYLKSHADTSPKPFYIEGVNDDLTLIAGNSLELAYRDGSGNIVNLFSLVSSDGRMRMFNLPTSAPAEANILWRDAATGQLRITPPA